MDEESEESVSGQFKSTTLAN